MGQPSDVTSDAEVPSGAEFRGYVLESPVLRWVMLYGNRRTLSALLLAGAFGLFVLLGAADVIDVQNASTVSSVFGASITGVFTLVAVTVSINQLVISRVLGSINEIEDRVAGVKDFREAVSSHDPRSPISPTYMADFLVRVAVVLRGRAEHLERTYDGALQDEVAALVDELVGMTHHVEDQLPGQSLPLFRVLAPVLNNPYSRYQHAVRSLQVRTESLTDEEHAAFEELSAALDNLAVLRHYVKTLYIHEELAHVSQLTLVSGLPALLVAFVIVLSYGGDGWVAATGEGVVLVVLSTAMTVVVSPLVVLFSYFIRIVSIARRTTTFGPFTILEELP